MPMVEYTFNPHAAEIRIAEIIVSLSKEFRGLGVYRREHTVEVRRRGRYGWIVIADLRPGCEKVIDDEALANGIAFLKSDRPGRRGDKPTKGDNMAHTTFGDDPHRATRLKAEAEALSDAEKDLAYGKMEKAPVPPNRMVPRGPFEGPQVEQPEQYRRMPLGLHAAEQGSKQAPYCKLSDLDHIEASLQCAMGQTAVLIHRIEAATLRLAPDQRPHAERAPDTPIANPVKTPALPRLRDATTRLETINAHLEQIADRLDDLV